MGKFLDLLREAAAIDRAMNRWNSKRFREIYRICQDNGIDSQAFNQWLLHPAVGQMPLDMQDVGAA